MKTDFKENYHLGHFLGFIAVLLLPTLPLSLTLLGIMS